MRFEYLASLGGVLLFACLGCTRGKPNGVEATSSATSALSPDTSSDTSTTSDTTTSTTSSTTAVSSSDGSSAGDTTSTTSGGASGEAPRPEGCPSTWRNCPPMDTLLEPLHELGNNDGGLMLAHGAFWLQGVHTTRKPDGSRDMTYGGALRIPYARGSVPRVLDGNVTIGRFVEYKGRIYHPDFHNGEAITVFNPEGDLVQKLAIPPPRAGSGLLMSPVFHEDTLAVTDANCLNVYFININDWSYKKLEIEGSYLGGVTSLTYVGADLYCMGNGYIFKIDPSVPAVVAEWRNPELEDGNLGITYSWLWETPQGLLTWRRSQNKGDESRFQLLDPANLERSDYFRPANGETDTYLVGNALYVEEENATYFNHNIGGGLGLHRFLVATKTVEQVVPTERPWGGAWDPLSINLMDDDYYYWIENWAPTGNFGLNGGEYIVRYPRQPLDQ